MDAKVILTNPIVIKTLTYLINKIVEYTFTVENYQKYGDRLFDYLEELVADSENDIDDAVILPLLRQMRALLSVPDLMD